MSERYNPRDLYRAKRDGKIPTRTPAEHVAAAEAQKRVARGLVGLCRLHNRPWTECTECSPATKKGKTP